MKQNIESVIQALQEATDSINNVYNEGVVNGFDPQPPC